jgi:hypothetical protein
VRFIASRTSLRMLFAAWDGGGDVGKSADAGPLTPQHPARPTGPARPSGPKAPGENRPAGPCQQKGCTTPTKSTHADDCSLCRAEMISPTVAGSLEGGSGLATARRASTASVLLSRSSGPAIIVTCDGRDSRFWPWRF